jgi:asparagine synthase (glutamine-hydrolysing)
MTAVCGFIGAIGGRRDHRDAVIEQALDALAHRGPDGRGVFRSDDVVLGHTRLAIIDPTARSDQPMIDEDSGCVLVFNGEIYNYVELRTDLERAGQRFASAGDTEVLLRSYLAWGERCVDRFNGMFAFGIWDPRDQTVFLARDRLGEKPLHVTEWGGAIWFASELKGFVAAGVLSPRVDEEQLFSFLAYGDLGHPTRTSFAGAQQLAPGHYLRVCAGHENTLRPARYWSVPPVGDERSPAGFAELFGDAVRLRLRSDVPLGTSLSGGLDSSLVLAAVRDQHPTGDLHAFTASFPGTEADELPRAQAVADCLGVTIHPVPLGAADLARDLDAMITANEGPVESPSTLAQYRVMAAAHDAGITVLLDGQGADETWGGYDKYTGLAVLGELCTGHPLTAARLEAAWRRVHGRFARPPVGRFAALVGGASVRRLLAPGATSAMAGWLSPGYRRAHASVDVLDGIGPVRPGSVAGATGRLDLSRVTLPRLLRYADRNSMAWSREIRLPFLDHRLVELSAECAFATKVVDGWTKEPVRGALSAHGLDEVARRRDKKAYMPPVARWLADPGVAERVAAAWRDLHEAGIVASVEPARGILPRWRILAVAAWLDLFGLRP